MGVFPGDEEAVNVVLVKGNDYKPTTDGTVVYLNAGDDLQTVLDKIEPSGGKILVPKTEKKPASLRHGKDPPVHYLSGFSE